MIDYIISNRNIYPHSVLDVRTSWTVNMGSYHGLGLGKFNLKIRTTKTKSETMDKLNIESQETEGTRILFWNKITQKLNEQILETDTDRTYMGNYQRLLSTVSERW